MTDDRISAPVLARLGLIAALAFAGGCSSKPPETDTAEVVPDPAAKPAPPASLPVEPAKETPK